MHKHGRLDANHREIVEALESIGASVQSLADIGNGCPDLLVGYRAITFLLEIKDGSKPPSQRKLTDAQQDWRDNWHGIPVYTATSPKDATDFILEAWQFIQDEAKV